MTRLLREPLVHFLLIGAAVFGLYALIAGEPAPPRDRIVVTDGRVGQLVEVFTRTWQRPPTAGELRGLVDGYVKEEVYYREAVKLGLDRDDTLIRRRMQQKMEFLTEPAEADLRASDAELRAFLNANAAKFRVEPSVAFEQIFISAKGTEQPASIRAERLLRQVRQGPSVDSPRRYGDATLLPHEVPLSPVATIARTFGADFADRLVALAHDGWSGPVASPYGLHLVRVTDFRDGYDPALDDVRKAVASRWRAQKRSEHVAAEYRRMRDRYEIVLPALDAPAVQTERAGDR